MAKEESTAPEPSDEPRAGWISLESAMAPPEGEQAFFNHLTACLNGTQPGPSSRDIRRAIVFWDAIFHHYFWTDISEDRGKEHVLGQQWNILGKVIAAACEDRGIDSSAISDAAAWLVEYRCRSGIGDEWSMAGINVFNEADREIRPKEEEITSNARRLLARLKAKLEAELQQDDQRLANVDSKPKRRRRPPSEDKPPREMTARQVEVVQLMGECKGNFSEVGRRLHLDRKTVEEHYNAAMKKLQQAGLKSPERKLKTKTTRLPEDRRGQLNTAEDLRRSQDT